MEVILASCGNPDHFQDPDQPMWGCEDNCKVSVKSLEEASRICVEFSRDNFLGGGNWAGGQVIRNNEIIAQIGHNGIIRLRGDKYFHIPTVYWEHNLQNL